MFARACFRVKGWPVPLTVLSWGVLAAQTVSAAAPTSGDRNGGGSNPSWPEPVPPQYGTIATCFSLAWGASHGGGPTGGGGGGEWPVPPPDFNQYRITVSWNTNRYPIPIPEPGSGNGEPSEPGFPGSPAEPYPGEPTRPGHPVPPWPGADKPVRIFIEEYDSSGVARLTQEYGHFFSDSQGFVATFAGGAGILNGYYHPSEVPDPGQPPSTSPAPVPGPFPEPIEDGPSDDPVSGPCDPTGACRPGWWSTGFLREPGRVEIPVSCRLY